MASSLIMTTCSSSQNNLRFSRTRYVNLNESEAGELLVKTSEQVGREDFSGPASPRA